MGVRWGEEAKSEGSQRRNHEALASAPPGGKGEEPRNKKGKKTETSMKGYVTNIEKTAPEKI